MSGRSVGSASTSTRPLELERRLGAWDGCLITIGAVLGSGIFLASGDVARALPGHSLPIAAWLAGGLLTLAGAVSYAELSGMFPGAGGLYHFLREAYGPLPGFLYGWTAFAVIMSGGIAALAAGFAEYLGVLVPSLGGALERWVAAAVIVGLTAINHRGVAPGAALQRLLTTVEVATIASFIVFGLVIVPAPLLPAPESIVQQAETAARPPLFAGAAAAMVAVLWCYDGFYGLAFSAGEMRHPERDVPRGMIAGTVVLAVLYILVNATYARALPGRALTDAPRVAESAAVALFGHAAARAVGAAILITTLGCLATTILYSSRIYLPMARDGIFFRAASIVHPRFRTPTFGLWGQSTWAVLLALTGTYRQLYTFVVFAGVLFHAATGAAVFVLRARQPDAPRPYRAWGYPLTPILFVGSCALLLVMTAVARPVESLCGLGLVALGLPAYAFWRRR